MEAAVRGRWLLMVRTSLVGGSGDSAQVEALLAKREDDPRDFLRCLAIDQDPESVFTPSQHQFGHAARLIVADENAVAAHAENALVSTAQPCWLIA